MDAERFDRWTRGLDPRISRRVLNRGLLAALLTFGLAADSDAKKKRNKKKRHTQPEPNQPCAESCANGCCASEFGACIPPAQQGGARYGTGGEHCHPCDSGECKPMGEACAPSDECCADGPAASNVRKARAAARSGSSVHTTGECCPRLVCAPESDFDPELRCLGTNGAPCSFISDCAGSLVCRTGRCCTSTAFLCEIAADYCSAEELCQVVPGPAN